MAEDKVIEFEEPLIRGNIVVYKCPKKNCQIHKFIKNDDGTVICGCGEKIIIMNPNRLLNHLVPGASHNMIKGEHFDILEGSNKDKVVILSTYLTRTREWIKQNRIYDIYIRRMLFRNSVHIENIKHRNVVKILLNRFDIIYNSIGDSLFLNR